MALGFKAYVIQEGLMRDLAYTGLGAAAGAATGAAIGFNPIAGGALAGWYTWKNRKGDSSLEKKKKKVQESDNSDDREWQRFKTTLPSAKWPKPKSEVSFGSQADDKPKRSRPYIGSGKWWKARGRDKNIKS
jgi:hypothetical protein